MGSDEKQATFTAKQQRDGVCVLPFIFAGLFGRLGGNPARGESDAEEEDAADQDQRADDGGYEADDDEDIDEVRPGFKYDWTAYRARFGDTPLQDAVTAMFAEYALLYSRIAGQVGASFPPPMTVERAQDISQQASRFVMEYVTPILGQMNNTKMHRLLAHVALAIETHGNMRHGSTASNESQHKDDKVFYTRTSKHPATFTAQLVRQAQGSRAILTRLDEEDAADRRAAAPERIPAQPASTAGNSGHVSGSTSRGGRDNTVRLATRAAGEQGTSRGHGERAAVAASGAHPSALGDRARAGGRARRPRRRVAAPAARGGRAAHAETQYEAASHHLEHWKVADVARRPGLATLPRLLGVPPSRLLPVLNCVRISAWFDCGKRAPQIVRASPSFRGAPWLDFVLYSVGADTQTLYVGEVRALLRLPGGDVAVVAEMAPVDALPNCPLAARGCTRLRWLQRDGDPDCSVRVVPVGNLRRVVQVVPDLRDLSARRGLHAVPAGESAPLRDRLEMRFFLNVFYAWDVQR